MRQRGIERAAQIVKMQARKKVSDQGWRRKIRNVRKKRQRKVVFGR